MTFILFLISFLISTDYFQGDKLNHIKWPELSKQSGKTSEKWTLIQNYIFTYIHIVMTDTRDNKYNNRKKGHKKFVFVRGCATPGQSSTTVY